MPDDKSKRPKGQTAIALPLHDGADIEGAREERRKRRIERAAARRAEETKKAKERAFTAKVKQNMRKKATEAESSGTKKKKSKTPAKKPVKAAGKKVRKAPAKAGELRLSSFSLGRQLDDLAAVLAMGGEARWPYVGLPVRHKLLSENIDGFRNCLYVLAGACRMGKSAFTIDLILDLLLGNEEAHAIIVSLDQPVRDLNIRMVAQTGEVNMEYLVDPTRDGAQLYEDKKRRGLETMRRLQERLHVVDESLGGLGVRELARLIEEKRESFDGPLFVAVDPIYKLRITEPVFTLDDRVAFLARELKTLSLSHDVGFLATTRLSGAAGRRRPDLGDLEEQASLLYEAHVICLLYCDYLNNGETPFLEWEWGTDDLMVPIFELNLVKNKMAAFTGRLYYRFYNSISKFRECSPLEVQNYNRMLMNLNVHAGIDGPGEDSIVPKVEDAADTLNRGAVQILIPEEEKGGPK